MSWDTYFTGAEADVVAANDQINANCGFPDEYTETWAVPTQAYQSTFWFIIMPPPQGYMNPRASFTQQQMIDNVQNVSIEQSQPDWWPPAPTEKG